MWPKIFLLGLFVGSIFAASNPGWRTATEYVYKVRARTLSSLYDVSNDYTGLIIRGKLTIKPQEDDSLHAIITQPEYAHVHGPLNDPADYIPDEKLEYKPLEMSNKPFRIVMKEGIVEDLIVSKEVSNWEANILKGIVSQFQLDTNAKNLVPSDYNNLPKEDEYSGEFKTIEDTVTGKTETMYNINEFPEYIIQSKPWLAPLPQLKGNGKLMEIIKAKNYSHSHDQPMYHYGWDGLGQIKPGSNHVGQIVARSSVSHAVVSGTFKRYTIQSSHTTNMIAVSPTLYDKQKGSVFSMVNVTLENVQSSSGSEERISDPVNLGGLVYTYNLQSHGDHVRAGRPNHSGQHQARPGRSRFSRMPRSLDNNELYYQHAGEENEGFSGVSGEQLHEQQVDMRTPAESPLTTYNMGYFGKPIYTSEQFDIVEKATETAQKIAQELEQLEDIAKNDVATRYVMLTGLTRSMSQEQLQTVATNLYRKDNEGRNSLSWEVYRDAVAECGSGPAFLVIRDWIQTRKVEGIEAADIISSLSSAARQPTVEYMKEFFALATNPAVTQQPFVNVTAYVSFTNLAYRVYVNRKESHTMYPVHSFGKFQTEEGKAFLREEVIPYFEQKLEQAIREGDSANAQVYIRALGNIGDQKILGIFEPYLEGHKKASHFQRLMMVVSLDNMVRAHPKVARSVLFKIYQNRGDAQELRIAAVYQLMRTSPPVDMLQKMAADTHIDTNEQVNAAVQSAINTGAELKGDEFVHVRQAAKAAQPLLTKKEYGIQYSKNYLRSYIVDEMKFTYKQTVQSVNDGSSYVPKGLKYSLRANVGGYREHRFLIESYVSSVDELVHEWFRQQKEHQESERAAQQGSGTSERIARLLKLEVEPLEGLEGNVHIKAGDFHGFFAYDNQSIHRVPEYIAHIEEKLRGGQDFRYNKIINQEDKALAYPTEMGVPFIFTYDVPTIVSVKGHVKGTANPQISNRQHIETPETIDSEWEIDAYMMRKIRGKIGFIAPFTHTLYSAGYDKNVEVRIPLRGKLHVDIKEHQLEMEIEPKEPQARTKLFHYSSWPYVASSDILSLEPTSSRRTTQSLCHEEKLHHMEFVLGQRSTGMPIAVKVKSSQKYVLAYLYKKYHHHDIISGMMNYGLDENIECNRINVAYAGDLATSRKAVIRLGYKKQYHENPQQQQRGGHAYADIHQLSQTSHEPQARQQEFINKVVANINNAVGRVFDASVEFQGGESTKFTATAAYGRSDVDPKSHGLVYLQGHFNGKPQQVAVSVKGSFSNTDGLDMEYALGFDPTSRVEVQGAYGENFQSSTKFKAHIELKKSEERKNYLRSHPMYAVCRQEMSEGNNQQPACANMTQEANLLDHIRAQVQYEQVTPEVYGLTYNLFEAFKYVNYVEQNVAEAHTGVQPGHWEIEAKFRKDLQTVNVTLKTEKAEYRLPDAAIDEWTKRIWVLHPTFNLKTRLMGKVLGLKTYRPICSIGKNMVLTFDNVTYPLAPSNGNPWYVMFQYVRPSGHYHARGQYVESTYDHLKHQTEKFDVFVRKASGREGHKDVKIEVSSSHTGYNTVEIKLQPKGGQHSGYSGANPSAKVTVDGQEIAYNDQHSKDLHQGYIQIYALPNGEVKIDIYKSFYVIYDGAQVKLTTVNGKLLNAIRGLCGNHNGEKTDDIQSPKGCMFRDYRDFQASWAVPSQNGNQEIEQARRDGEKPGRCIYKNVIYGNVISDRDAGRAGGDSYPGGRGGACSTRRTRYVTEDNKICFTIEPQTACNPGCQAGETVTKQLPVHCVQKSNVANLWKNQIDQGASPDFSRKAPTQSITIEIPVACRK